MKKTIADLKLQDPLYSVTADGTVHTSTVKLLSVDKITLSNSTTYNRQAGDPSSWQFESGYGTTYYLSKLDALMKSREYKDGRLKLLGRQLDELSSKIKEQIENIRYTDILIAEELHKSRDYSNRV